MAPDELVLLGRCVSCFERRYPGTPTARAFRQRLRQAQRQRLTRRILHSVAAIAALVLGLWTYDAWGEYRARRVGEEQAGDPVAVRQRWQSYQLWHPTRHLLRPAATRAEKGLLAALDQEIRAGERATRLAALRRQADDPDADPEVVWKAFRSFHADFPEHDVDPEWRDFRARVKARSDARQAERARVEQLERERKALLAFRELERAEALGNLPALVDQANRWLRQHAGTSNEPEVTRRRTSYLRRLDDRSFEAARIYSARNPLNFATRRQRYQEYLDHHPHGLHAKKAREALRTIATDWDKYDFRAVRDHYQARPGDVKELQVRCRSYLAAHPEGRWRAKATELLRWTEQVTAVGEYRVTLKSGSFDKKVAHLISRGAYLSVEIEVGGVRYGPSNIVRRSYTPEWNYEFPRRVRWKLGDTVRIYVTDNYYWRRKVAEIGSDDYDPLAMRMLSGEVNSGSHSLTFESDFTMPVMPRIE
jgi:hypothetical protein